LTFFFLFSLALFAYWLRSSVVSVLFSLISEIVLLDKSMIKSIFETRLGAAEFTHVPGHSVSGITLPPDDAPLHFSLQFSGLFQGCEEDWFG
jgi:hypothetical protein